MADSKTSNKAQQPAAPDNVPKTAEDAAKLAAEAVQSSDAPPLGHSDTPRYTERDFTPVHPMASAMRSAGEPGDGPRLVSPGILNDNPDHALQVLRENPPKDSVPGLDPTPPKDPGSLEMVTLRDGNRYAVRAVAGVQTLEPVSGASTAAGPGPGSRAGAETTGQGK